MSDNRTISAMLATELEGEFAITRGILASVPEGSHEYRNHDKSRSLAQLAAHTAETPMFAAVTLTAPPLDLAAPHDRKPHRFESTAQNLAAFDALAAQALETLKQTADETFREAWKLHAGEYVIFNGDRYNAYRMLAVNHMIHHRAQLGTYLRLLDVPLPKTYGPSADFQ